MGTFEMQFTSPDLTSDHRYLPISSVVLSNHREKLADNLASAEKNKRLVAANPLVKQNEKRIPSVTRMFRRN